MFGPLEPEAQSAWADLSQTVDAFVSNLVVEADGRSFAQAQVRSRVWRALDSVWARWLTLANLRLPSLCGVQQECGQFFEYEERRLSLTVPRAAKEADAKTLALHHLRAFKAARAWLLRRRRAARHEEGVMTEDLCGAARD